MKVLVLDDEAPAVERTLQQLAKIPSVTEYAGFINQEKALEYLRENKCDVALLDVSMYGLSGLEVARLAKNIQPGLGVVFLTGYSEYALDAFRLHADGYLLKPATREELEREITHARPRPLPLPDQGVFAQTFGTFEITVNGKPLKFARNKSKELLAYLIDRRGATVTSADACAALWMDTPVGASAQSALRNCVADMRKTLSDAGADGILDGRRGTLCVLTDKLRVDYYEYLKGDPRAVNAYMGEYMSGYEWAEMTAATLDMKSGVGIP